MYYADMILPVSAYPQSGYKFDYWSDPHGILADTSNSITDANISEIDVLAEITAYFKPMEYNSSDVNISTGNGGEIIIETDESGKFTHFRQYSLRAIPDAGYKFSHWSGERNETNLADGSFIGDNSLIMDGPISNRHFYSL